MEDAYWSLIESTLEMSYPNFVADLRRQVPQQPTPGNSAVFELKDGMDAPEWRTFGNSEAFRVFLDQPPAGTVQRVIVLEDLPRNFVVALGSRLKIPPSFFGDHWENPEMPFTRRTLRSRDSRKRYMLKWRRIHRTIIAGQEKDGPGPYAMSSRVARTVSSTSLPGDPDGMLIRGEKMSLWREEINPTSWVCVILIDPPLTNVWKINMHENRLIERRVRYDDKSGNSFLYQKKWCPPYSAFNILPPDPATWTASETSPGMSSMLNDLLSLFKAGRHDVSSIPDVCRRMILWSWIAQVHLQANPALYEAQVLASGGRWNDRTAERLVEARLRLRSLEDDLDMNMNALGIDAANSFMVDGEAEDWKSMKNTITAAVKRINLIYDAYVQTASIHESQAASQQARSVTWLTSLATAFLPASLTAGIFAMAGDFAAGASMFWVFWAVSIPSMLILFCFFFFVLFKKRKGALDLEG